MPSSQGFLPWRRYVQSVARQHGIRVASNEARVLAVSVAAHFGVVDDGEYDVPPPWGDPTGEAAVMRVLTQQARHIEQMEEAA